MIGKRDDGGNRPSVTETLRPQKLNTAKTAKQWGHKRFWGQIFILDFGLSFLGGEHSALWVKTSQKRSKIANRPEARSGKRR